MTESHSNHSVATEFEEGMRKARLLLESDDLDGCLKILGCLEEKYVHAVKIFDLFGDAFLHRGNVPDGIRYKTLHSVLAAIFETIIVETPEAKQTYAENNVPSSGKTESLSDEECFDSLSYSSEDFPSLEEEFAHQGLVPITAAMGHEFMKQGHFDLARDIFDKLLKKYPGDESLKENRSHANRMNREKRLLGFLHSWLRNIKRMKSNYPRE